MSTNNTDNIAEDPASIEPDDVAEIDESAEDGIVAMDEQTEVAVKGEIEEVQTHVDIDEEMPALNTTTNANDNANAPPTDQQFQMPDYSRRTPVKEQFEKLWDRYFFALKEIVTAHTMQQLAEQVQPDDKEGEASDAATSPAIVAVDVAPAPATAPEQALLDPVCGHTATEKEKAEASFAQLTASSTPPTLANLRAHDSRLARWVSEQKRNAKNWEAGLRSTMTEERMAQLNSISFFTLFPDKFEHGWNENFERLKAHYLENGDFDVKEEDLKKWMRKQRAEYDNFEQVAETALVGMASNPTSAVVDVDKGKDGKPAPTETLANKGIVEAPVATDTDAEMAEAPVATDADADAEMTSEFETATVTAEAVADAIVADAISAVLPAHTEPINATDEAPAVTGNSDDDDDDDDDDYDDKEKSSMSTQKTSLTRERMDKLDSINFVEYSPSKNSLPKFQLRLKDVLAFKEIYGHVKIPKVYPINKPLGRWVARIRTQYRCFKDGKPSCLTEEMVEQLNAIGFEWESTSKFAANVTWETRFEELIDYKEQYQDCNVPKKFKRNLLLGTWVRNQRYQYVAKKRGKKSPITEERIEQLNSVGFQWTRSRAQT
jgi:hypothetical protein